MEVKPEELADYLELAPTYHDRATRYIADGMHHKELAHTIEIANDFANPNKPMTGTAVLIPVAAAQESGRIGSSLAQYANQITDQPFSIFLLLNYPDHQANSPEIQRTVDVISQAQRQYPHLDIRTAAIVTMKGATIGNMRRVLWDSVLLQAHREGILHDQDVIGISHDADTVYLSPRYIKRIQQAYAKGETQGETTQPARTHPLLLPMGSRIKHAYPSNYPNIAKVIAWTDASFSQYRGHTAYEEGIIIPLSWYAHVGGFNPEDVTHETKAITYGRLTPLVPGALMETSPRRYIDRLQQHGLDKIWTEDSFTAHDACRQQIPKTDIPPDRMHQVIADSFKDFIPHHWAESILVSAGEFGRALPKDSTIEDAEPLVVEYVAAALKRRYAVLDRVLRSAIGSDELADQAAKEYPYDQAIARLTTYMIELLVERDFLPASNQ